ncbi:unnamed protein product, partial [Oppiella nova]
SLFPSKLLTRSGKLLKLLDISSLGGLVNSNSLSAFNSKVKPRVVSAEDNEETCESMVVSNPAVTAIEMNGRQRERNTSVSENSMVLRQSFFSPQTAGPIAETEDKTRDSLISNNEVPPTYEEAKHLPSNS